MDRPEPLAWQVILPGDFHSREVRVRIDLLLFEISIKREYFDIDYPVLKFVKLIIAIYLLSSFLACRKYEIL